jgi:hypothetical protein
MKYNDLKGARMDDYTIDESGDESAGNDLDALFTRWMNKGGASAATMGPVDPPVPMPEKMEVHRGDGSIRIVRRWFQPMHIFTTAFAVIWNIFVFGFFSVAILGGGGFFALFSLPFFGVGIFIAYFSLAGLLNRTVIDLSAETLSVVHTPIPWPGTPSIAAADIEQLYSVERVHHHSSSSSSGVRRRTSTSYTYEVRVIYGSPAQERKLVGGLSEPSQALFIEHTIEHQLGIVDRAVRGELRRNEP